MLRSAQRKSTWPFDTATTIPPATSSASITNSWQQGAAQRIPCLSMEASRYAPGGLSLELMNGRLYLAVKTYASGRPACRCATWCFNRCQVHVDISGNGLHPLPPSQLCFVDPRPPSPAANMGREIIAKVSLDDGALAWGLDPRCSGRTLHTPHKRDGVGTLLPDLSLSDPGCFIVGCKAHPGSLRMASFSKERVHSTIFTVKLGAPNLASLMVGGRI